MSKEKHLSRGGKNHQTGTQFWSSCPTPVPHREVWTVKVIEGDYEWQWEEALTSADIRIDWQTL